MALHVVWHLLGGPPASSAYLAKMDELASPYLRKLFEAAAPRVGVEPSAPPAEDVDSSSSNNSSSSSSNNNNIVPMFHRERLVGEHLV